MRPLVPSQTSLFWRLLQPDRHPRRTASGASLATVQPCTMHRPAAARLSAYRGAGRSSPPCSSLTMVDGDRAVPQQRLPPNVRRRAAHSLWPHTNRAQVPAPATATRRSHGDVNNEKTDPEKLARERAPASGAGTAVCRPPPACPPLTRSVPSAPLRSGEVSQSAPTPLAGYLCAAAKRE